MDPLERFLTACRNGTPDRPPLWLLRQAGRYLPEYRKISERYGFKGILASPELAAKVAFQPLRRYGLDASIVFSDILIVPQAAGVRVSYTGKGVRLSPAVASAADLRRLDWEPDDRHFDNLAGAVAHIRSGVGERFPVIGFAGAPFTLACYMIEGGGKELNFMKTRVLLSRKPGFVEALAQRLAAIAARSLIRQIEASADAVMLFDSLAEILDPGQYARFALPAARAVFSALEKFDVPKIYHGRGASIPAREVGTTGATVFAADWRQSLARVREQTGGRLALQGNLDPALLFAGEDVIRSRVRALLAETGGRGHIVNLGAGMFPATPTRAPAIVADEVRSWRGRGDVG
jgi:uroporphyrinogen decarboxylase